MSKTVIEGGARLAGEISVHGAKNAVLPILAATILTDGISEIKNCPELTDVRHTVEILRFLGARVTREGDTLTVDARGADGSHIPESLMRKMRSSIIFMGAIIARNGRAKISAPGGCELGPRPIDLHTKALKELGVGIEEKHGYIICDGKAHGGEIYLKFPSVGATENIMLASCLAEGETVISNVAKEPEISDLQKFLNEMGAEVSGAGTSEIRIKGAKGLHGAKHSVLPDRIVATTYLCCAAATGSEITVKSVVPEHLSASVNCLRDCGCEISTGADFVHIKAPQRLKAAAEITTMPYPGFPTDVQSQFLSMLTVADGTSVITENIFDSRFKHTDELIRMGADVTIHGRTAVVKGAAGLSGANVTAYDLRGAAALVIAGLCAEGKTTINDIDYMDRGYESFEENLRRLGAKIKREHYG